jgi:hypothetical protein
MCLPQPSDYSFWGLEFSNVSGVTTTNAFVVVTNAFVVCGVRGPGTGQSAVALEQRALSPGVTTTNACVVVTNAFGVCGTEGLVTCGCCTRLQERSREGVACPTPSVVERVLLVQHPLYYLSIVVPHAY